MVDISRPDITWCVMCKSFFMEVSYLSFGVWGSLLLYSRVKPSIWLVQLQVGSHKIRLSRGPEMSASAFDIHLTKLKQNYGNQVRKIKKLWNVCFSWKLSVNKKARTLKTRFIGIATLSRIQQHFYEMLQLGFFRLKTWPSLCFYTIYVTNPVLSKSSNASNQFFGFHITHGYAIPSGTW